MRPHSRELRGLSRRVYKQELRATSYCNLRITFFTTRLLPSTVMITQSIYYSSDPSDSLSLHRVSPRGGNGPPYAPYVSHPGPKCRVSRSLFKPRKEQRHGDGKNQSHSTKKKTTSIFFSKVRTDFVANSRLILYKLSAHRKSLSNAFGRKRSDCQCQVWWTPIPFSRPVTKCEPLCHPSLSSNAADVWHRPIRRVFIPSAPLDFFVHSKTTIWSWTDDRWTFHCLFW